jgi:hypothetical protein
MAILRFSDGNRGNSLAAGHDPVEPTEGETTVAPDS